MRLEHEGAFEARVGARYTPWTPGRAAILVEDE